MKTFLTIAFVAFLAVTTSAVATTVHPSYTQSAATSCFSYFRAHRQLNGVSMMWGVSQQGAKQFKIERSYDGEFFDEVAEVTAHGGAQYRYIDREVFPGYITYRITATMEDGTIQLSQFQTVRIVVRK
jgi:hypothetical protein